MSRVEAGQIETPRRGGRRARRDGRSAPSAQPGGTSTRGAEGRLRIAYLTTEYPKTSHTFIRREIVELERRGHEVLRLSIRPGDAKSADAQDAHENERTHHVLAQPAWRVVTGALRTMAARPVAALRSLSTALDMARASDRGAMRHLAYFVEAAYLLGRLRRAGAQHVHVHFGTNATAVARLMRRMGGPTYSFTVHGPDEFDAPRPLDLGGKIADASVVVAITSFCGAQLRRWCPPEHWEKIEIVRCSVGDEWFDEATPIDPDSRTLVCVGRLCPQKGQLLLIEALGRLRADGVDARLVLAGDGEMRADVERRAAAMGVADRVEITGWIGEAEVRRRLREARALALPSFAEGLPMVIMEALAMGRPVISTYIAGIPELVRDGENGWLTPAGSVEALAGAMDAALEAPAERLEAMAQAGREAVRARHRTASEVDRLEALLMDIASREEGRDG